MQIQIETLTLPAYWASALVNGDYSGLSDGDAAVIDAWLIDNPGLACVACSDHPEIAWVSGVFASSELCETLEFDFHVTPQESTP